MTAKRKKELLWAIQRAHMLLVRNACRYETFHGVLNRADVRALRTLAQFVQKVLIESETLYIASRRYPVRPIALQRFLI